MSKKKRLKRKACTSKVRYKDIEAAQAVAVKVGTGLEAYWCRFCKGWHIGH